MAASANEAESNALFVSIQEILCIQCALIEIGNLHPLTLIHVDNKCATGIVMKQ